MGNLKNTQALILLLLYLGTLLISLPCPDCPYPTSSSKSPKPPPKYLPKVKPLVVKPPPHVPKPPTVEPLYVSKRTPYFHWQSPQIVARLEPPFTKPPRLPRHPFVHHPLIRPELPIFVTLPITPKPPIIYPPIIPTPLITPTPLVMTPPPLSQETPCHPPPPPPHVPKPPPHVPKPPIGHPSIHPNPPILHHPITPKPPIIYPPIIPIPPITPAPPVITPPPLPPVVLQPPPKTPSSLPSPEETPCPPLPLPKTCPTLKLDACINELGSLVNFGVGSKTKDTCCPMLAGLLDLDAALCLCTTIKAKRLNINIVIPKALQVLVDCGKTPPSGFQCPA